MASWAASYRLLEADFISGASAGCAEAVRFGVSSVLGQKMAQEGTELSCHKNFAQMHAKWSGCDLLLPTYSDYVAERVFLLRWNFSREGEDAGPLPPNSMIRQ